MTRTVIHYSDSTTFGGTERAILRLIRATDSTRWRPVLLHHAGSPEALVDGARCLGAETSCVPLVAGKFDVASLARLTRAVRRHRASVLHAHLPWPLACKYGIAAARAARVPAIVATAQLHVELDRAGFVDLQHRLVTSLVDRYIAVSADVAAQLERRFAVPPSKVTVVPNAVDIDEIDAGLQARPFDWPVPPGRRSALVLARLESEKGIDVAIQAVTQIRDLHLVIAGTGSSRAALEATATTLGVADRVHFLGHRADPAALLGCADAFVLPSLVEGFPLSVLEAMAAGVPVVATDIAGTREAVEHGRTGLLVPPRDPTALADAVEQTLAKPRDTARRAARAREHVRRDLSSAAVAARVSAVYESVLTGQV